MSGKYVTFSKNIFIPVTNVCRSACDYCVFRARSRDDAYVVGLQDFLTAVRNKGEATEALFSGGENPEDSSLAALFNDRVTEEGFSSLVAYTKHLCKLAIQHGLLPHCNLGVLDKEELLELKDVNASMGLMLETTAVELEAHRNSPGKDPALRLQMIEEAGELKIPFTTGILIGIGESNEDRIHALEAIASVHEQYGHIQEVIIQPFLPKPGTAMWNTKSPDFANLKEIVRAARSVLPDDVAIQIPPNLTSPKELIELGASDLGGISERTIDYINPEAPWPAEHELRREIAPYELRERLPIYPQYIKKGWYSDELRPLIERYADEDGLRSKG
jgi:FO synthase subunit 1